MINNGHTEKTTQLKIIAMWNIIKSIQKNVRCFLQIASIQSINFIMKMNLRQTNFFWERIALWANWARQWNEKWIAQAQHINHVWFHKIWITKYELQVFLTIIPIKLKWKYKNITGFDVIIINTHTHINKNLQKKL